MEGPVAWWRTDYRRALRPCQGYNHPAASGSSSAVTHHPLPSTIPNLSRSSLHRCIQRHGIIRLLEIEGDKPAKQKFKAYPIGYFHIDIAEVRSKEEKLYLFVAIDRTSNLAFVPLHEQADRSTAVSFRTGTKHLASHQTTAEGWLRRHSLVKNHKSGQNSP